MAGAKLLAEVTQLLNDAGLETSTNVTFPWMTNRVPIEDDPMTPARIVFRLTALHVRLGGDWDRRVNKREKKLRFDIMVGSTTLIEIDPIDHFTSEREISFDYYDEMDHQLDIERYRDLCKSNREHADKFLQNRSTTDFPFPGGRASQVAFFDTAKDLLAPAHNFRLIRLPAPEGELTPLMSLTLRVLL